MLNYCCHAVLRFRTEFARGSWLQQEQRAWRQSPAHIYHSKPFCPTHTVHFNCSWFLSLFQSPQAASPFIFLNSLPFSGSHLLCLSRKCLLLCLNLKKKTNPQHFLPVLLESSAHPGLLLTVSSIFVSIAVTLCREKMGRCKISLQSKKWMSLQTILYSNPN